MNGEWLFGEEHTCWKFVYGGEPPTTSRMAVWCARSVLWHLVMQHWSDYVTAVCQVVKELKQLCPYDSVTGVGVGPAWPPFSKQGQQAVRTSRLVFCRTESAGN